MEDINAVFFGLQNLLTSAANIAKCLWGQRGPKQVALASARQPLRDSIGVTDDSPLKQVWMRNHFEHYDERIDEWQVKSKNHNYNDLELGTAANSPFDEIDMFRSYDPKTGNLGFWGQSFDTRAVIAEIQRILPKLKEEASKPHWKS